LCGNGWWWRYGGGVSWCWECQQRSQRAS
jgi:hypothetical protein